MKSDLGPIDGRGLENSPKHAQRGMAGKPRGVSDKVKYVVDVALAVYSLVIMSPMLLMVAGILYLLQGWPIFIRHERIGKSGILFPCIKFRTMITNSDVVLERHLAANPEACAEWEATRKLKNDPRITPFGAYLRKTSLDELPQLLNVIRGEMSLVGPRPITLPEAKLYGANFADYIRVRPGLTGLWQISGRNDVSYDMRVALDARYVANRTFWGDFVIMAKTIPAVVVSRGTY
jgi:exopolysaccharide production protein ExoY